MLQITQVVSSGFLDEFLLKQQEMLRLMYFLQQNRQFRNSKTNIIIPDYGLTMGFKYFNIVGFKISTRYLLNNETFYFVKH